MLRREFVLGSVAAASVLSSKDAEAKANEPTIFAHGGGNLGRSLASEIKKAAGGNRARLLISPYSSKDPSNTASSAQRLLRDIGFTKTEVLDIRSANGAKAQVANADAIWFTGGFQKTQVLTLGAVPGLRAALTRAHANGVVMAGSSAGAAVMSRTMISGGTGGAVYTRAGLGFWKGVVLDQHVGERHREYRLRKLISGNRKLIGLGLDEGVWVRYANGTAKIGGRGTARLVFWSNGLQEKEYRNGSKIRLPA